MLSLRSGCCELVVFKVMQATFRGFSRPSEGELNGAYSNQNSSNYVFVGQFILFYGTKVVMMNDNVVVVVVEREIDNSDHCNKQGRIAPSFSSLRSCRYSSSSTSSSSLRPSAPASADSWSSAAAA